MDKRLVLALVLLSTTLGTTFAQISLSPYSRYGLGDIYSPTNTRNYAMGGIGIGSYDPSTSSYTSTRTRCTASAHIAC